MYFTESLKKGDIISSEAVRSVRPGYCIAPKYIDKIIGSIAKSDIKKNSPVGTEYINNDYF